MKFYQSFTHPGHLGNLQHLSGTIPQSSKMNNDIYSRCDLRTASSGSSIPINTIDSRRVIISPEEFACPVERLPSCPVFIAASISMAAASLTSPTITRSGRIRRLDLISSRIVTAFVPSTFEFRLSSRTRFTTFFNCNSAESSIVITQGYMAYCLKPL